MRKSQVTKTITLDISVPPSFQAKMEIDRLFTDRDLQKIIVLGPRKLTAEEHAENRRRSAERQRRRIAIIKKYGVVQEYLEPLLAEERRLSSLLSEVRQEIAALRAA